MTFQELGLRPEILKAITDVGYTDPTPIQERAIAPILQGHDVIGAAQTGTGKTAAFLLPILQILMEGERKGVRALILEPTRELAQQVEENLCDYGKYTGLRHTVLYGGVGLARQQTALKEGMDILVATPGRLLDHMDRGNLFFFDLRLLVLDEADRMTDMGFLPDLKRILKRLPGGKQTLLFSATIPPEIETLARATLWEPVEVLIGERAAPAEGVTHFVYPVRGGEKLETLKKLLETKAPDSTLIFTKTKKGANELGEALREAGLPVGILHSDRTQQAREATLKRFRDNEYKFLVATDIAGRGLDIDGITHIVNYDVPLYPEDYVHRIGRTARAKAVGEALTLVTPEEERRLRAIEKFVRQKLPRFTVDGEPLLAAAASARDDGERRQEPRGGRGRARGGRDAGTGRRVPREAAGRRHAEAAATDLAETPLDGPSAAETVGVAASGSSPNGRGDAGREQTPGGAKKRRRGRRGGRRRRRPESAAVAAGAPATESGGARGTETGRRRATEKQDSQRTHPGAQAQRTASVRSEPRERGPRERRSAPAGRGRDERAARRAPEPSPRAGKTPAHAAEAKAAKQPALRKIIGKIFGGWGGKGKG